MDTKESVSLLNTIRSFLNYDAETGFLLWSKSPASRICVGDRAGRKNTNGYRYVKICGVTYLEHRLIWFYVFGEWPRQQIDHIDGDKSNNRIDNLRDVGESINKQNRRAARVDSRTGVLGVRLNKSGKYETKIKAGDRRLYVGSFDTLEEAHRAHIEAKRIHHKGNTL